MVGSGFCALCQLSYRRHVGRRPGLEPGTSPSSRGNRTTLQLVLRYRVVKQGGQSGAYRVNLSRGEGVGFEPTRLVRRLIFNLVTDALQLALPMKLNENGQGMSTGFTRDHPRRNRTGSAFVAER